MSEQNLEQLLRNDFDAVTAAYEKDGFERKLLFKLEAKQRARMGVIAFAGGIGAALAASQFNGLFDLLVTQLPVSNDTIDTPLLPYMAGALMLAGSAMAAAFIMRREF